MCDLDVKFSNLIIKFIFAMVIECIMHIWTVTDGMNDWEGCWDAMEM